MTLLLPQLLLFLTLRSGIKVNSIAIVLHSASKRHEGFSADPRVTDVKYQPLWPNMTKATTIWRWIDGVPAESGPSLSLSLSPSPAAVEPLHVLFHHRSGRHLCAERRDAEPSAFGTAHAFHQQAGGSQREPAAPSTPTNHSLAV